MDPVRAIVPAQGEIRVSNYNPRRMSTIRRIGTAGALFAGMFVFLGPRTSPVYAVSDTDDRLVITVPSGLPAASQLNGATNIVDLSMLTPIGEGIGAFNADKTLNALGLAALQSDLREIDPAATVTRDRWLTPAVVNDPLYGSYQSSLTDSYGINATSAWEHTTGSGVTIAVVDSGVRADHEDLSGQFVPGYDFISSTTHSNDDDGRDADPTDPGDYNSTATDSCPAANSTWHGTHVTGTIIAKQDNSLGITGIAPSARVLPVRALGRCGGWTSDVLAGIEWAAGLPVDGVPDNANPARIVNLSLSGAGVCGSDWEYVLGELETLGVLAVVAAGNENADAGGYSPASCDFGNVITVSNIVDHQVTVSGVTYKAGARYYVVRSGTATGSNFGAVVDIGAPGFRVGSTVDTGTSVPLADGYALKTGTSMATPHVAGAAALMWSVNPALSYAEVRAALLSTSRTYPDGLTTETDCLVKLCGAGALDAGAAVQWALDNIKPGAPRDVTALRSGTSATVSWTEPLVTGSTPITEYTVYHGATLKCTSATTSCTITGLAVGGYSFTVKATNSIGTGPASSASNTVNISAPPSAPNNVAASRNETSITVTWTTPSRMNGATITSYTVSDATAGSFTVASNVRQKVVSNLTPGATYTFSVAAVNSEGAGAPGTASALTIPSSVSAPAAVRALANGESMLDVSWSTGTGGLAANSYRVTAAPSSRSCETSGLGCTITGLSAGTTYSVVVRASGVAGNSANSSAVFASTASVSPTTTTTTTLSPATSTTIARTTTTTSTVSSSPPTTVAALVRTVKRSSRTALTRILAVPAGHRAKWTAKGPCYVSGTRLVAKASKGTCKVTLKATRGSKSITKSASVRVV